MRANSTALQALPPRPQAARQSQRRRCPFAPFGLKDPMYFPGSANTPNAPPTLSAQATVGPGRRRRDGTRAHCTSPRGSLPSAPPAPSAGDRFYDPDSPFPCIPWIPIAVGHFFVDQWCGLAILGVNGAHKPTVVHIRKGECGPIPSLGATKVFHRVPRERYGTCARCERKTRRLSGPRARHNLKEATSQTPPNEPALDGRKRVAIIGVRWL